MLYHRLQEKPIHLAFANQRIVYLWCGARKF
jgi:hypothetical protein